MLETFLTKIYTVLFAIPFLSSQELYPLTIQMDIQDILFQDEFVYFITKEDIRIFDTENRSFLIPLTKPENSSVSILEDEILICEWENFEISNPDEYSTVIHIYNIGSLEDIFNLKFHETLKTTNCSTDVLYLETSLPFLEKKFFSYDISEEILKEYEKDSEELVVNTWRNIYGDITVRRDSSNILWVYRKILKF